MSVTGVEIMNYGDAKTVCYIGKYKTSGRDFLVLNIGNNVFWNKDIDETNKSDVTIEFKDKDRNIKEKQIPQEVFDNMIHSGLAKRVYRVFIKDPMSDYVLEDFWELTQEQIDKFVDENDTAYCLIAYEKGEKKYMLLKKELWDSIPGYEE